MVDKTNLLNPFATMSSNFTLLFPRFSSISGICRIKTFSHRWKRKKSFHLTTRGSIAGRPNSGTPALYLLPMFTKILEHDLYLYFEIVAHDPGTYFSICILKLVSMFSMILEHILYLYFVFWNCCLCFPWSWNIFWCVTHNYNSFINRWGFLTYPNALKW